MPVLEDVQQERIRVIQTYWKALMTGDMKLFETLLADDVVVHYPGQHSSPAITAARGRW